MPICQHYDICGLTDAADPASRLCILHSRQVDKDPESFTNALRVHRQTRGDRFTYMVFPMQTNFGHTTFDAGADFFRATFSAGADFRVATFSGDVRFSDATFSEEANFFGATFSGDVRFSNATFSKRADFTRATFSKRADFTGISFESDVTFSGSHFHGRVQFTPLGIGPDNLYVFRADTSVDFRSVVLESPESFSFQYADFRTCRFLNMDLRKIELTEVLWPKSLVHWPKSLVRWPKSLVRWYEKGTRHVVYDEIAPYNLSWELYPWAYLERLYRELKQNYDDHRNYLPASDFHYGEKEMQRRNPATPWGLKVFLWFYWLVSGYGERFLRPLLCALVLLIVATVAYLGWGLVPKAPLSSTMPGTTAFLVMPGAVSRPVPLPLTQPKAWLNALHYSLRVMTLLKPEDLEPMGFAKFVQTLQSLLGPLFLGLFALAVRQRLKR
jgi:uncharacterized protein YjbI with pentapeptide repeats